MSRKNDIVNAVARMLAPMERALGGPVSDVAVADAKFTQFLAGRGGKFDLPLVAVAYAGSPQTASSGTRRLRHSSVRVVAVFVVTNDRAGIPSEMTAENVGLNDLTDRVEDLLAGSTPYLVNEDGDYLKNVGTALEPATDGSTTETPAINGVALGHPLECLGDEPVALPAEAAGKNLVCWSVGFRFVQAWMPDRADATDPADMSELAVGLTVDGLNPEEPAVEVEEVFENPE
jgi:hypothetical protein